MKIRPITSYNQQFTKYNTNFLGKVNGKFYDDSIIEAAKNALKNPKWETELRANKSSFFKDYATAHEDDLMARIVAGIVSLGGTELIIASVSALGALSDDTEEKIKNIKDCMIDLLQSKK